jgi:hypothetical protein
VLSRISAAAQAAHAHSDEGRRTPHALAHRELWSSIEPIHAQILRHPFVTGLTDGSLDPDAFRHYVLQDAHYLRDYARALANGRPAGSRHSSVRPARRSDTPRRRSTNAIASFAASAGEVVFRSAALEALLCGDLP